jgi:hypothetical protein
VHTVVHTVVHKPKLKFTVVHSGAQWCTVVHKSNCRYGFWNLPLGYNFKFKSPKDVGSTVSNLLSIQVISS